MVSRRDRARKAAVVQGLAFGVTAAILWWLAHNTLASLDRHGISLDLDFLSRPANFDIGDTAWLHYSPDNSVGRAVLVGLVNTARVSVVGCVLAIGIGFVVGVLRLSHNPALRGLMRAGVELVRNTPLLLLLLLLSASLHGLPSAPNALRPIPGWYLSNRGLVLPSIGFSEITVALAVAVIVALVLRRRFGSFGWRAVSTMLITLALSLVIFRPTVETAHLNGFNFIGGTTLSPEFAALLAALV
ncbi:MAG TPA: ABC transporter permease subunit, partial [Gemmatimonadaceae bacterium]|nr:ABC transporter permease subunit [Gemmatimonadaceae bacterium]